MRIAVVDDERLIRKDLVRYIEEICPGAEVFEAENGESAVELAAKHAFDIFFLDINLGDMKGTVLAMMLQNISPDSAVIFVTAYGEYGAKAFDLDAIDYIMKPFSRERVEKALRKAESFLVTAREGVAPESAQTAGLDPEHKRVSKGESTDKIIIRHGKCVTLIDRREIVFVESKLRTCRVCCTEGKDYVTNQPLAEFVSMLNQDNFMRIHKSFIVNLDFVLEIAPLYSKNYCVKLRGYEKEALPIGRNQLKKLREIYQF